MVRQGQHIRNKEYAIPSIHRATASFWQFRLFVLFLWSRRNPPVHRGLVLRVLGHRAVPLTKREIKIVSNSLYSQFFMLQPLMCKAFDVRQSNLLIGQRRIDAVSSSWYNKSSLITVTDPAVFIMRSMQLPYDAHKRTHAIAPRQPASEMWDVRLRFRRCQTSPIANLIATRNSWKTTELLAATRSKPIQISAV